MMLAPVFSDAGVSVTIAAEAWAGRGSDIINMAHIRSPATSGRETDSAWLVKGFRNASEGLKKSRRDMAIIMMLAISDCIWVSGISSPKQPHITPLAPKKRVCRFATRKLVTTRKLKKEVSLDKMPEMSISPITISTQGRDVA
jgi:hypothetical protein